MRTTEEMAESDILYGESVHDTLAFCVVASDFMRARRRRFPLSLYERNDSYLDDSVTIYMAYDIGPLENNLALTEDNIMYYYPGLFSSPQQFLWNYGKEYLEDD